MRLSKTVFTRKMDELLAAFSGKSAFENLLIDLSKLNAKYLQQLLSDLNSKGSIYPFHGEYHKMLISSVETMIIERTMLK